MQTHMADWRSIAIMKHVESKFVNHLPQFVSKNKYINYVQQVNMHGLWTTTASTDMTFLTQISLTCTQKGYPKSSVIIISLGHFEGQFSFMKQIIDGKQQLCS